jgi:hypothetical protein
MYKHIHHGEYANMYIMLKWCQKQIVHQIGIKKNLNKNSQM